MTASNNRFNTLLENVYKLSIEDKETLISLIEHNIAESKRQDILSNYKISKNEKMQFSSDIDELKKMI
jgi:hypothetical protein